MQIAQANLEQLMKKKMRSTWIAGDFGQVARYMAKGAEAFVERLEIRPTDKVLDVACGTGNLAMANWTREGLVGNMFALGARFFPPPEEIQPPVLWGAEGTAKEVVQFFWESLGPAHVAFSRLEPQALAEYAAELERLWREHNEDTGTRTLVRAEYLKVIAIRA